MGVQCSAEGGEGLLDQGALLLAKKSPPEDHLSPPSATTVVQCGSIEAIRLNPLTPDNCLFTIGMAEYVAERYEEALEAFGKVKGWGVQRPAWIAACYAQLGRDVQAQAVAAEVRELAPSDPSVPNEGDIERWRAYWTRINRFENSEDQERFFDGLRKAGLPAKLIRSRTSALGTTRTFASLLMKVRLRADCRHSAPNVSFRAENRQCSRWR